MKKLPENDPIRVQHMLEAGQKVLSFTEGKTKETFLTDELLQLAVIRLIEILGEAASQVTDTTRQRFPEIAWQDAAGMRNHVAHRYFNIDLGRVWDTVQADIPGLVHRLPHVLTEIRP
jgi:uncharacterized protein with HEPN domain